MTSQPPAVVDPRAHEPAVLRYGDHPDQWVECWDPAPGRDADAEGPARGLVLVVHGGYWQAPYTLDLMRPIAADLAARGWAVANIEYRRDAEGRWPVPEDDVREGIAAVLASAWARRIDGPRVSLGHSVGGQLALLTAEAVDAVVALAPVTDVPRVWREGLGQDAARRYFGASPEEAPCRATPTIGFRSATPSRTPRLPRPRAIPCGSRCTGARITSRSSTLRGNTGAMSWSGWPGLQPGVPRPSETDWEDWFYTGSGQLPMMLMSSILRP